MLLKLNQKRGQSIMEYAVLVIIVIAALLVLQNQIKRGVQGRLHQSAKDIGDEYSSGNMNIVIRKRTVSNTTESLGIAGQGKQSTVLRADEYTNTEERRRVINTEFEYYGPTGQANAPAGPTGQGTNP